jgi:hypothetical protein
MKRNFIYLICGLLALATGCGSSPSEVEDADQVLIVQAYLVPGQDTELKLKQTLPPELYYDGLEELVSDVRVEIAVDGERFVLSEDPGERGVYRIGADAMPVVSGKTYQLTVTQGERQLRASTLVPQRAEVTHVSADTIVYLQQFANLYGELIHPGEFFWNKSENAAAYIIIVEAVEVHSLGEWALPLTADLDTLIARREQLERAVSGDSLESLDREIDQLRNFFAENVSLTGGDGEDLRWLRDRDQEDWDKIDLKENWSEGKKWREKMDELFFGRVVDFWMPADTLRSDFWWLGVRFEGEYRLRLQAADQNYSDYYVTSFNGQSGSDGDKGPVFHVDGGLGVFGSYAEDSFRMYARRGEEVGSMKVVVQRE